MCRACRAERSQFHVQMRPSISRTLPFDSSVAPLPCYSQPTIWGAGSCPQLPSLAQHQLPSQGCLLLGWHPGLGALAPPHSWFPCNEDVKMNRTWARWWPHRTSNSPEQLKTETSTRVCIPLQGGWNWSKKEKHWRFLADTLWHSREIKRLSVEQGMLVWRPRDREADWDFLSLSHFPSLILHRLQGKAVTGRVI